MGGLYNFLVLIGGTYFAYYLVSVIGRKLIPGKIGGWKVPGVVALILQVMLAGLAIPLLGEKFLLNIDKTYGVIQEVAGNEYLYRVLEANDLVWSVLTMLAVFFVIKVITEALEDRPEKWVGSVMALVIIFVALTGSYVIWDFLGLKVWVESITLFDKIWFQTEPGKIIRDAIFPEMEVYP